MAARDHESQRRLERYREHRAGSLRRESPARVGWSPLGETDEIERARVQGVRDETARKAGLDNMQQRMAAQQHMMDAQQVQQRHHPNPHPPTSSASPARGWEAERAALHHELRTAQQAHAALQQEVGALRAHYIECEQLREQNHRLSQRLAAAPADGVDELDAAREAHAQLQEQNHRLSQRLAAAEAPPGVEELQAAREANVQLQKEAQRLSRLLAAADDEVRSAREAHAQLQKDVAEGRGQAGQAERLEEQNQGLRQHLAKLEREMEARAHGMEQWRERHEQEAEAKIAAHREAAERELATLVSRERKARESLTALQHAVQHDETGAACDTVGLPESCEEAAARLASALLSAAGPGADSDALRQTVERCFAELTHRHRLEKDAVEAAHDASIRQLELEHRGRLLQQTQLQHRGDGEAVPRGDQLAELREECGMARDDLEHERQRVAMVCIHMKSSLELRNKQFEAAVMKKANSMVAEAKQRADDAEARLRKFIVPVATSAAQTDALPAPESYLATAVSSAFRREAGIDPADAADEARHDAARNFERDVMQKAQSLLQKYAPVAMTERTRSRSNSATPAEAAPHVLQTLRGRSPSLSVRSGTPQMCLYP
eukprot:TRINITY_DN1748_c0_g1_i1.p1 TRINITY_DN1748_c0_g1~~TRINITY_DN1748_c0_g1_i1.p1  ORF type:complete len:609 (+),score=179.29 TRINITY_DN1748_c0_g1_i1:69-1895(+)